MNPALLAVIAMANRRRAEEEEAEREESERKSKCGRTKLNPRPVPRRPSRPAHDKPVEPDDAPEKGKGGNGIEMLIAILVALLFVDMLLLLFCIGPE